MTAPAPATATPARVTVASRYPVSGSAMAHSTIEKEYMTGGVLPLLSDDTGHGVITTVKEGFDTASWSFDGTHHQIVLGDAFADAIDKHPPSRRTAHEWDLWAQQYASQLLRHEAWHGRITHRDLKGLASLCRSRKVPFMLLNLFEDARIEHTARSAEGKKFNWLAWQDAKLICSEPAEAFFQCIVHETPVLALDTLSGRFTPAQDSKVCDFYRRAAHAGSTLEVLDLCVEWMDYWRSDEGGKREDGGTVARPGSTIKHLHDDIGEETDGSVATSREAGAKADEEDRKRVGYVTRDTRKTERTAPMSMRVQFKYYQSKEPKDMINQSKVTRLAQRMESVVVAASSRSTARLSSTGTRIHIPALASMSESAFRSPGKRGGTPTLITVVDMSGSMSGEWYGHGRLFSAAIIRLLREGKIAGKLVLTGGDRHAIVPPTISDADFNRLRPGERNETIAATLDAMKDEMVNAHYTVVYTDGEITDGEVDAKRWRMRGVQLVGACVVSPASGHSSTHVRDSMHHHFGHAVLAPNGEALAMALATKLGNLTAAK